MTAAPAPPTVDRRLISELKNAEDARFHAEHPRSNELRARARASMPNGVPMAWFMSSYHHEAPWVAEGHGSRFTDVDGHTYHDFNIADLSMFCGYAPEPLVRAVSDRIRRGNQLTAAWGLQPDLLTCGKSIAGGVPFGAWGMTDAIADVLTQVKGPEGERANLVALGGTLFANALSMAAARAVLTEILTPEAYANTQRLGARLADGMRVAVERAGLPWYIHHLGPRAGYTFRATPVRDAAEARACQDDLLTRLIRVWLANRGVWEAIVGAGPVCSVPAADEDVDAYLAGWDSLLARLTA